MMTNLFTKTTAAEFNIQAKNRTKPLTPARRFVNHIVDIMSGESSKLYGVNVVPDRGIELFKATQQYWPLVQEICECVPGVRSELKSNSYLTILPVTSR